MHQRHPEMGGYIAKGSVMVASVPRLGQIQADVLQVLLGSFVSAAGN